MENSFWEKIIIDHYTEYHLLRHFHTPSKACLERLFEKGILKEKITMGNSIPGSKFHIEFASDVYELISRIKNIQTFSEIKFNDTTYLNYHFNLLEFPNGIGTNSIINRSLLTEEQKDQIYISEVRGYPLQYLLVDKIPKCWELTIVLKGTNSEFRLISAFPGEPGLPLPNEKMDKKTKQESINYWDEHIMLIV